MADYTRYEKQFNALMRVLDTLEARYRDKRLVKTLPRRDTILYLVRSLRVFAQGQFYFFYCGFNGGQGDYPPLKEKTSVDDDAVKYPPEHVLANTIAQISADITTIQLAAEQRILNYTIPNISPRRQVAGVDLFTAADRLGELAMWPHRRKPRAKKPRAGKSAVSDPQNAPIADGDWEVKTVLTYLTDSVKVRVVPYSQVMLLGIPYTCLEDLRSFLAIPHEVGHFRYWYSFKQTRESLAEHGTEWEGQVDRSLNLRELFYHFESDPQKPTWSEEIFADVYGTLVGGPLSILTAMELALEHSTFEFQNFDSEETHPTPLIRPILMIKALKAMDTTRATGSPLLGINSVQIEEITIQLLNRWKRKLQERGILEYTGPTELENDDSKDREYGFQDDDLKNKVEAKVTWDSRALGTGHHAEKLVQQAVNALLYAFRDLEVPQYDWGWTYAPQVPGARVPKLSVKDLYDNAERVIEKRFRNPRTVPELELLKNTDKPAETDKAPDLWKDWVTNGKGYFKSFPLPKFDIYAGELDKDMDPTKRPTDKWLPVYGAGGWTTEGPCAMPPG